MKAGRRRTQQPRQRRVYTHKCSSHPAKNLHSPGRHTQNHTELFFYELDFDGYFFQGDFSMILEGHRSRLGMFGWVSCPRLKPLLYSSAAWAVRNLSAARLCVSAGENNPAKGEAQPNKEDSSIDRITSGSFHLEVRMPLVAMSWFQTLLPLLIVLSEQTSFSYVQL